MAVPRIPGWPIFSAERRAPGCFSRRGGPPLTLGACPGTPPSPLSPPPPAAPAAPPGPGPGRAAARGVRRRRARWGR
ncbi:hypothetical protein C0216_29050 [Streptomyces globosus]|uniref:Uncharacterized protein n=1 Tax=Streptomyces globosus TaxID=68209 RepID=A0A344U7R4_9ACTN|nr:hypothetical protein C0216_29050 [Streptomyces globosus]